MRYVKGHGLQTRSRIVEEASYALRQGGADGMSVADLCRLGTGWVLRHREVLLGGPGELSRQADGGRSAGA